MTNQINYFDFILFSLRTLQFLHYASHSSRKTQNAVIKTKNNSTQEYFKLLIFFGFFNSLCMPMGKVQMQY